MLADHRPSVKSCKFQLECFQELKKRKNTSMLTISKSFIVEHHICACYWRSWDENKVSVTQPRSQEERPWKRGWLLPSFCGFLQIAHAASVQPRSHEPSVEGSWQRSCEHLYSTDAFRNCASGKGFGGTLYFVPEHIASCHVLCLRLFTWLWSFLKLKNQKHAN